MTCFQNGIYWSAVSPVTNPTNTVDIWAATVAGDNWTIRINDFPDEYMYPLLVNRRFIGDFLEWPEAWLRDISQGTNKP